MNRCSVLRLWCFLLFLGFFSLVLMLNTDHLSGVGVDIYFTDLASTSTKFKGVDPTPLLLFEFFALQRAVCVLFSYRCGPSHTDLVLWLCFNRKNADEHEPAERGHADLRSHFIFLRSSIDQDVS